MLDQLEKVLEQRTTVKYFDGNPIPQHLVDAIKKSVAQTPSCNNRYNFKVKVLGQSLEHRRSKVGLYEYICTVSSKEVRYDNENPLMVSRSPRTVKEAHDWRDQGILRTQINGQTLAPLLLVWYFDDGDPIENDYLDVGLSCWNSIITAEALGVQSGFCGCFDNECLKEYLDIKGLPVVMVGFGFASEKESNEEKHPDKPRPSWGNIIS
jgi:nitroreductase